MRCSGLVQDTVIEEPLVRSPGRIVALAHAGSIPLLAGKLAYGSQKVDLQAHERLPPPPRGPPPIGRPLPRAVVRVRCESSPADPTFPRPPRRPAQSFSPTPQLA